MSILAFGIWSNIVLFLYRHHFVQSISQKNLSEYIFHLTQIVRSPMK